MKDQPSEFRIPDSLDDGHAVRHPRIEHRQSIEQRLDRRRQARPLHDVVATKRPPVLQRLRVQNQRLPAREESRVPARER